jgi:hypothetical protein
VYCDNKDCPIHGKTTEFGGTLIVCQFGQHDEIEIAVPCMLCEHVKKVDFGKILKKVITKNMLRQKRDKNTMGAALDAYKNTNRL